MVNKNTIPQTENSGWTLVILAAGLGSRFGGIKQLHKFSSQQVTLIELNVAQALTAGMSKLVLVVNEAVKRLIKDDIEPKLPSHLKLEYVIQAHDKLPTYCANQARTKPWGTAHALWCCRGAIDSPFVVINADDYYPLTAFEQIPNLIKQQQWALIAFPLHATLSAHGGVNRGICQLDKNGQLRAIAEATQLNHSDAGIYGVINGQSKEFDAQLPVSMNFWLFDPAIFTVLDQFLTEFFSSLPTESDIECYLPEAVFHAIKKGVESVNVVMSSGQWFGITYPQDVDWVEDEVTKIFQQPDYACCFKSMKGFS